MYLSFKSIMRTWFVKHNQLTVWWNGFSESKWPPISDFRISGQSLIKENCPNSRTSDDIDIKLGPVTKLDKGNKTTSKKFDVDVMSENCNVIVIFRIFGQFGAIRKPDSGHRVYKSYFFSNRNLFSYKNWKQN